MTDDSGFYPYTSSMLLFDLDDTMIFSKYNKLDVIKLGVLELLQQSDHTWFTFIYHILVFFPKMEIAIVTNGGHNRIEYALSKVYPMTWDLVKNNPRITIMSAKSRFLRLCQSILPSLTHTQQWIMCKQMAFKEILQQHITRFRTKSQSNIENINVHVITFGDSWVDMIALKNLQSVQCKDFRLFCTFVKTVHQPTPYDILHQVKMIGESFDELFQSNSAKKSPCYIFYNEKEPRILPLSVSTRDRNVMVHVQDNMCMCKMWISIIWGNTQHDILNLILDYHSCVLMANHCFG
jgi:hypothetical protein